MRTWARRSLTVLVPSDYGRSARRIPGVPVKEGAMSDRIVGYGLCLSGFGLVWLVSWLL